MKIDRPALGRPMDPSYASNRLILIATPAIGAVAGLISLLRGDPFWEAVGWGISAGGSGFLAWAITRELHPDHSILAAVATGLAPIGLFWGRPDLLASAMVLLVGRALAGTTGLALRWSDIALLLAVGAPLVVRDAGPAALGAGALGLAGVLVWDGRRSAPAIVAPVALAAGCGLAIVLADPPGIAEGGAWVLFWVGVAAGIVASWGPRRVESSEDLGDRAGLRPARVRSARIVALATAAAVSLTVDPSTAAPIWAGLAATSLRPV